MKKKISVIVPVYNTINYLKQCIESIINQTYNNLEIILVDDGSTDGSSQICDEYLKIDSRIKIIHKENGGSSSSRNEGIKVATGSYISFIDSDDWLMPNFYENMAKGIIFEADIVNGDYSIQYGTDIINKIDFINKGLYKSEEMEMNYLLPLIKYGNNMQVWNNLYSIKLIKGSGIFFVSEKEIYAEDDLFNLILYSSCKSIYKVKDVSYIHRINKGSLSQSYRKNFFIMQQTLMGLKIKHLKTKQREDLIQILKDKEADIIAYSLYKESLCKYSIAVRNVKKICKLYNYNIHEKDESHSKFSILYALGKRKLYNLIVLVSKFFHLSEPLYRWLIYHK